MVQGWTGTSSVTSPALSLNALRKEVAMNNENVNDQNNVGAAGAASPGAADAGAQGGDTASQTQEQGTPSGQNGNQPNLGADKEAEYKRQIKALNKAVIDSRRASRQKVSPTGDNSEGSPFDSEAGQYAASLELSDARLRGNLEERIGLYPELPPEEVQRIRLNPWAFASRNSFLTGDWETALDEVEQAMLDRAEALEAAKSSNQPQGQQPSGASAPAQVNANPAPEGAAVQAVPGTVEDEDPWTMPLDKLEQRKNQAVAKLSQPQQK